MSAAGNEAAGHARAARAAWWRPSSALARGLDAPLAEDGAGPTTVPGHGFALWLLGLRWVAVIASLAVLALSTVVSNRIPADSAPFLWSGIAALFAFNLALCLVGAARLASQAALAIQVAGDVVILGFLVHHADGLLNPFAGFFVFHAAIAAVVLEPRRARGVAFAIAAFVLLMSALEASGAFSPGCILDAAGVCAASTDFVPRMAAGVAVAAMVVGCALFITTLVNALHGERERITKVTHALATHAQSLAEAQTEIQRERQNLQTIIDCMADAVLYVTPDGAIRLRNKAAEKLFPASASPIESLRVCHRPEKWKQLSESLEDPGAFEFHPVFESKSRSYEATYARVCSADGALLGVVMVARDVTERLQAQRWQMQEERMAVVGKLAAGIAHELNNPLGAIALFAQHALAGIRADHPLYDHIGTVLRNANICKKIVRDLLEYARQRPPERCDIEIGGLLGDVIRTIEPRAQSSRVVIRSEVVPGADAIVRGDPDQLHQVLVNLGLNAIEAMQDGGTLTFRVVARAASGGTEIEVVDTGHGISDDESERIFAAFHTTKPGGTGLGLTVARDLVVAHGGTLTVKSSVGEGTTFVVSLPRAAAEEAVA